MRTVVTRGLFLLLAVTGLSVAGERYSGGTGNWNAITWYSDQSRSVVSTTPGATDTAYIGATHVVTLNLTTTVYRLVINDNGTSGTLTIGNNGTARTLSVTDSVVINSGGTFDCGATAANHNLNVTGSIRNSGTVDFVFGGGSVVRMFFVGSGNRVIYGEGSWDTQNLTFNANATTDSIINRSSSFTQSIDFGNGAITWTQGIYSHEVNDTAKVSTGATTIAAGMTVSVVRGGMYFGDGTGSPTLTLQGLLRLEGGQVNVSHNATGAANYQALQLTAATAALNVAGGTLNVGNPTSQYGNLNLLDPGAVVTVTGGEINAQRYAQNPGAAGSSFTISNGALRVARYLATGTQSQFQFLTGTFTMNGGTVTVGEDMTAISGGNIMNIGTAGTDGAVSLIINDGTFEVCGDPGFTTVANVNPVNMLGVAGLPANLRIGDGSGGANSAIFSILPNLAAQLPTPATRNLLDLDLASDTVTVNSDGLLQVGGGNIGNFRLNVAGAHFRLNGGTCNVTASFTIDPGTSCDVLSGTFNIGTGASNGTNTLIFGQDPGFPTYLHISGGTVNVGDGNSQVGLGTDSDNNPTLASGNFDSIGVSGGTLNIKGNLQVNDGAMRFSLYGTGVVNIDPNGDQDIAVGTTNICYFRHGIVRLTGGTLRLVNANPISGTGVTLYVNNPSDAATVDGLHDGTGGYLASTFTGSTIEFGDGSSIVDNSSDGFDMSLSSGFTYDNFSVNNPSGGNNRHVTVATLSGNPLFDGDFTITTGKVNIGTFTINGNGGGTFTLGSGGHLVIGNTSGNNFPTSYASYSIDPASTVEFNGSGNVSVNGAGTFSYGNLTISGSGTKTLSTARTVLGTLTLTAGTLATTTNLTMGSGSSVVRTGDDSRGIMTGTIQGSNSYRVQYDSTSKTAQLAEWSGVGRKSLIVNLDGGSTLTYLSQDSIVRDSLVIGSGSTLADNSRRIEVQGDIRNDGAISGSGRILIRNGSAPHSLYGSGSGVFGKVEISVGADSVLVLCDTLRFSDSLQITAGKVHLGSNALELQSGARAGSASPSSSNMIQVSGLAGEGALVKNFAVAPDSVFWPVGVFGSYTPAKIELLQTGSSGSVTLRCVDDSAATKTNKGRNTGNTADSNYYAPAFVYHWDLERSGLTSGKIAARFYYTATDSAEGTYGGTYSYQNIVPGRYSETEGLWFTETTSNITPSLREIKFTGGGTGISDIAGEYTAGQTATAFGISDAFGTVDIFYSRQSGSWTDPNSWSLVGYGGAAAATVPGPNSPVKIRSGDSLFTADAAVQCASLVDSGVVDVRNPSNKKFGSVSGNGKIIIRPTTASFTFPTGTYTSFMSSSGRVEYTDSTGLVDSYTLPASPTTYGHLLLSTFTGTGVRQLPNAALTINNDLTLYSGVGANFSDQASGNITLSGNLSLNTSGDSLRFLNGVARAITVGGHITVASGAVFHVQASGTAVTNTLSVGKGVTNNGIFDMLVTGSRLCNVTFTGTGNDSITGTGSITDFNRLIVNKGTSQAPVLRVNATNFSISGNSASASRPLTLTNGTFRLSSAQTVTLASGTLGTGYDIPATAALWIDGGTAQLTSTVNENILLRGKIQINGGTLNVGTVTDGSVVNSIVYDNNNAAITVNGGTMTVGGSIRNDGTGRNLAFALTGGTLTVGRYKDDDTTFEISGSGSSFTMTGGLLQIVRANAAAAGGGLNISATVTSYTVTGGTVQVLTANSANQNMSITSSVPFYNLQIGPAPSYTAQVGTPNGNSQTFTVLNNLRLNFGGTFRLYRVGGTTAQNVVGLNIAGHLYRDSGTLASGTTSTTTFNGTAAHDSIYGNGSTITFQNLTLNNTFGGGKVVLGPSTNIVVTGNLTSTSGTFDAVSNKGNVTMQSATANQTITISTSNLTLNNLIVDNSFGGTGVTVSGGDLVVDSTLTLTNGILNIGANGLTINDTIDAVLGGPFSDQKHIQTSGVVSDKGVTRGWPSLPADYTFPVGTSGNYTPARIVVYNAGTTPAAGTVNVIPVASIHPNLTGGQNDGLNYYWKVSKTGLSSDFNDSLIFDFKGAGVTGSNYNTLIGGYFVPFAWQSGTGAPANASFSPTDSTMRFTNPGPSVLQADYTASLGGEFGAVTTYYSLGGSWTAAASWSTAGFGGTPAGSTPTSSTPVIIGDSKTINITGASVAAASVYFDSRTGSTPGPGTLNITSTNTHNLGDVSGIGTIILNPTGITPIIPTGTYSNFVANDSGTFIYGGSINYTIPTGLTTYNNLVLTNSTTKTLGASLSVNGSLRVLGGALTLATFTATHQGAAGDTLFLAAGSNINVTNTGAFPASYQSYDLDSTSRVAYSLNGAQNVHGGITYGRLYLNTTGSAAGIKTLLGNITVKDSLSVVTTTGINHLNTTTNNYNISLKGHLTLSQTSGTAKLVLGNNTVTLNGNNAQNVTIPTNGTLNFNNLVINNTSGVTFGANTQTDSVRGTMTIGGGTNVTLGAGNSWFVNGGLSYPSQTGTLTGSSTTNLSLTGTTVNDTLRFAASAAARSLNNFTVNRTATSAAVVVTGTNSDSLTVNGTLTLTRGILRIQNIGLIKLLNTTTPVSGGDSVNYVDGRIAIQYPASSTTFRTFPIGSGSFYRPVRLYGTSGATAPIVRVEIIPRSAPTVTFPGEVKQTSNVRFYRVDVIGGNAFNANTDTLVLSFRTNGYDLEGIIKTDSMRILRSTDSLNWGYIGGAINNSKGYNTVAPAGKDSGGAANILHRGASGSGGTYFMIATLTDDNTLPVGLAYFRASQDDGKVRLEWRTESETNNAYWMIQRREVTGDAAKSNQFESVKLIQGQGTSTVARDYTEYDDAVEMGKEYVYRLADVSVDGVITYHDATLAKVTMEMPTKFALRANYPNPFNPSTTIRFELPVESQVTLKVYNIIGQEIATLADRRFAGGVHNVDWNGLNKYNQNVSSGIYIYRIMAVPVGGKERFIQTRKMMLMK